MKSVLITSSILILLIAALRPLLRGRMDPRVQYALWAIVALRLLVPVEWAVSSYSALALLDRAEEPRQIVESIGQTTVPILNPMSYEDAYDQVMQEREQNGQSVTGLSEEELIEVHNRVEGLQTEVPTLAQMAEKYAKPVWLGGAALMGLWFLLVNFQLRRKLRRALPVEADCPLPVFVSLELPSPCLCGAVRPAIYVTPDALADPARTRHVLTHELTHCRHRDHWWALVRCLCLCVYWFNPLVWWAAAMSRQDCELACDAGAIRRLGEAERLPYGRTLVAMIASGRNSLLQTATTMTGGKRRVKERVQLIARKPRTVIALALALVLIIGLAVGCTFTGAPEESPSPDPNPLSSDALTVDTLRDHLLSMPEELQENVRIGPDTQSSFDSALASYWMERPWTDYEAGWGWLLTVYRWDQEEFDANYQPGALSCFARDGDGFYYVILRASDARSPVTEEMAAEIPGATGVEYHYGEAFDAVWDYVEQTVLATEGVEPCILPDTLRGRLNSVPMELQDDVMTGPGHDDDPILVRYWMNRDWTSQLNPDYNSGGLGFLLYVEELSQAEVNEHIGRDHSGWECFARRGDTYYAIASPTDVRFYTPDDADDYHNAYDAIREYAIKTVLETDGVEPFTPNLTLPNYYIDGMDYTLVTSYKDVPEDPEQWFLVGQLPNEPVWMFTRDGGAETMFQIDGQLTQAFPYRACYYGGGQTHDGRAPQLMRLSGGGNGHGSRDGAIAVIAHLLQGGTDHQYQLTAYDLNADPITAYVHDWKPLMEDFNQNHTIQVDPDTRTVSVSYQGQTAEVQFWEDDELWNSVLRDGTRTAVYEWGVSYTFNDDGTANLLMPTEGPPYQSACWTLRFTGSGFETVGFQFVESNF